MTVELRHRVFYNDVEVDEINTDNSNLCCVLVLCIPTFTTYAFVLCKSVVCESLNHSSYEASKYLLILDTRTIRYNWLPMKEFSDFSRTWLADGITTPQQFGVSI